MTSKPLIEYVPTWLLWAVMVYCALGMFTNC